MLFARSRSDYERGEVESHDGRARLCRCGQSERKPACDGSCDELGFHAVSLRGDLIQAMSLVPWRALPLCLRSADGGREWTSITRMVASPASPIGGVAVQVRRFPEQLGVTSASRRRLSGLRSLTETPRSTCSCREARVRPRSPPSTSPDERMPRLPVSDAFNASYEVLAGGVEGPAVLYFGIVDDDVECLEQFLSFLGLDERVALPSSWLNASPNCRPSSAKRDPSVSSWVRRVPRGRLAGFLVLGYGLPYRAALMCSRPSHSRNGLLRFSATQPGFRGLVISTKVPLGISAVHVFFMAVAYSAGTLCRPSISSVRHRRRSTGSPPPTCRTGC